MTGGDEHPGAVAIIGMACRFPGAPTIDAFWHLLRDGREAITRFALDDCAADPIDLVSPQLVCAEAVLDDADAFDARLFGIAPAEAIALDPQRRVLLECAWAALEDAGRAPGHEHEVTAVYAAQRPLPYLGRLPRRPTAAADRLAALYLNEADYLATYLAFRLGLTGESLTVQTACSSALVAVHLACQSLISRQSDLAVVGVANIELPQRRGYVYQDGIPLSRDGTCRPFDRDGSGVVPGNGAGAVVLRRLDDAVRDADPIRAVVLAAAINNDGARKHAFAAPSVDGQAEVIAAAHELAGVASTSISYVEAHGTATQLGDAIEIEALRRAFGAAPPRSCGIGAVKSNVGHLHVASGMASLIKTVLALEHGELPPTLHFRAPNPRIGFDASPFFVVDRLLPWQPRGGVRRAGVSAFGIGGTNAHVVVEQARAARAAPRPDGPELIALSAATPGALAAIRANLARYLRDHPALAWRDAVATQNTRTPCSQRWVAIARDRAELVARLDAGAPFTGDRDTALATRARQFLGGGPPPPPTRAPRVRLPAYPFERDRFLAPEPARDDRRLVWVFSGGGHWPGMGCALRDRDPAARASFERLERAIGAPRWRPVAALLFDAAASATDPSVCVVAIFAMQVVLAEALARLGVTAQVAVGHGDGEVAAAWWAGALTLEDAARVVAGRAEAIAPAHGPGGSLAAQPTGDAFAASLDGTLAPTAARIALWSTVTAAPLDGRTLDARYWGDHRVAALRFAPTIRALALAGERAFLEIAPTPVVRLAIEDTLGELEISGETYAAYGEDTTIARAAAVVRAGHTGEPLAPATLAGSRAGPAPPRCATTALELARAGAGSPPCATTVLELARAGAAPPSSPPCAPALLELQRARDPRAACVVFPGAGASGAMMAPWAALLPPSLQGLVFDPPGHGADRRPIAGELDALLDGIDDALRRIRMPIVLVGYSFGCLLAYDTARRALAAGLAISHLVLSHGPPPHWWHAERPSQQPRFAAKWEQLHAASGLADLDIPLDRFVGSVVADYRIGEAFPVDAPPVAVATTLVASAEDELYPTALIAEWRRYVAPAPELVTVSGGHFDVVRRDDNRARYRALFEHLTRPRTDAA